MVEPRTITVYSDYKSPYAYLAKNAVRALEREVPVRVEWVPYILDIPSYLGSATVDENGTVREESRNAHQWRRVRYSYMDCRRQAQKQGLTILGPRKIWDSSLAAAGMLFAQRQGGQDQADTVFRRYHDQVFDRFWRRELDIENVDAINAELMEAGAKDGFPLEADTLRQQVAAVSRSAEALGVFGVPSFMVDGALFWGQEHLGDIRERLRHP